MSSSASGPFPLLGACRVLSEEAMSTKKPNSHPSLKRMTKVTSSLAGLLCSISLELLSLNRHLAPHSAPHKLISRFLSTRRSSQCISELLFLSHDHIILSDPCYSIHGLQTLETFVAYFQSRGSGLMYHLGH